MFETSFVLASLSYQVSVRLYCSQLYLLTVLVLLLYLCLVKGVCSVVQRCAGLERRARGLS